MIAEEKCVSIFRGCVGAFKVETSVFPAAGGAFGVMAVLRCGGKITAVNGIVDDAAEDFIPFVSQMDAERAAFQHGIEMAEAVAAPDMKVDPE